MRLFKRFYQRIILLARHKYAGLYLMALSFLEAFILPVSPAVLQIPLTLALPKRAWRYVFYAFIGSFIGGVVGYLIGDLLVNWMLSYFHHSDYYDAFLRLQRWVHNWGVWVLFPVSLLPLPYKLTTIASGILGIPFGLFMLATAPARALHFAVVAYIFRHRHMRRLQKYLFRRFTA